MVTDEAFTELCSKFTKEILLQLKNNQVRVLNYFLTFPYKSNFSVAMLRMLLNRTFGYSCHWVYDAKLNVISIPIIRFKEYVRMVFDQINENYDINLEDDRDDVIQKIVEAEEVMIEEHSFLKKSTVVRNYNRMVLRFYKSCILHTDCFQNNILISGKTMYLMFCFYVTYITRGEIWDHIDEKKFYKLFDGHILEDTSLIKRDKKINSGNTREKVYMNMLVKLPKQKAYPYKRLVKDTQKRQMVHTMGYTNDSTRERLKKHKKNPKAS